MTKYIVSYTTVIFFFQLSSPIILMQIYLYFVASSIYLRDLIMKNELTNCFVIFD